MQEEQAALVAPFPSPTVLFTGLDPVQVISVLFTVLFIIWAIYTIVTAYHWLRYGHRSAVAIPALITHVAVSGFLALFAVSGIRP
ncbi:MAG: hypothetical protein AB199_03715 [Parcubacteria bacterium C7867-004]|nr:MAG: hypothetical protein AB199_03715 [Parcubacteria bacterium C7867-004]